MIAPPYIPPAFDRERFKALVQYVCYHAPRPELLGATKLNKILLYSDREAYLLLGRALTGEVYIKREHGPVPRHAPAVLRELEKEKLIRIVEPKSDFTPRIFQALAAPPPLFTQEERRIVDAQVDTICRDHTARSISKHSHDRVWERVEMGEAIPYYTVYEQFVRNPDARSLAWAREQVRLLG